MFSHGTLNARSLAGEIHITRYNDTLYSMRQVLVEEAWKRCTWTGSLGQEEHAQKSLRTLGSSLRDERCLVRVAAGW